MKVELVIILQLVFNAIVIGALLALRSSSSRARARTGSGSRRAAQGTKRARSKASAAPALRAVDRSGDVARAAESGRETGLDELVEDANVRELAAERALRARLAQFRASAAQ